MLKKFNDFNIGKKLLISFAAVVLVLITLSVIVFVNVSSYVTSNTWNIHTYEVLSELEGITTSMVNMETGQRGFSITGDEKFLDPYNQGKSAFDTHFNKVKELTIDNATQQANLEKVKELKESWQQVAESSISLRREVVSGTKAMNDVIKEETAAKGKTFMDNLRGVIQESIAIEDKLLDTRTEQQKSTETTTKMVLIFGTLLAVILAVVIAFYISRVITSGIQKVTQAANKLSVGDMNIDINVTTKDEIGELADSFTVMKNAIKELIEEVKSMARNAIDGKLNNRGDVNKFKGDYKEIVEGINKTLDAVVEPVQESIKVLDEMAKSNLQVAVEGNFKGDHAILKDTINNTISSFNEVLGNINVAAEQVATGAKQVSLSSQSLSQGSTEQASTIEEITASIEEIASQTRQNAANANQANGLASVARDKAIQGNNQMAGMLNAMTEINSSSTNISKIIKVIDDIAFQTNILALNAAVEAARAGQHGKGFAVVAEEVRNLAARSADAAKETTALIEGSIEKVETGSKIANATAEALNEIVDGISKAANLVAEITNASNDQASGIAQINQSVTQISDTIRNNSATSEESAAASEELSSQAELLKELVSKYKLSRVSNNNFMSSLSPDVMKMLESMASRKSRHEGTYSSVDSLKPQIVLNENDFGKY